MPSKNPGQRLSDIVENIDNVEVFTAGMDLDAFASDRKTLYAVVRIPTKLNSYSDRW